MKKWTKGLIAAAFAGAFVLTGCSAITQIKNDNTEILYGGGSVVSVGDYLFYGNGYASGVSDYSTSSDSEYKVAQAYSYLSRTNLKDFKENQYKNENEVNKISDRVTGYSESYMFAIGKYIYYATPNLHKTNENKFVWNYVSIFRTGINGGSSEEIYTTEAYDSSKAQFRALSYNGKNYLFIYDGTNLIKLTLEDKVSIDKLNSSAVTSVALPDEGEDWNGFVYYTTARESEFGQKGNVVYRVNVASNESKEICKEVNLTVTFTGRVKNKIFFSRKVEGNSFTETYMYDADTAGTNSFNTASKRFFNLEVFDVDGVAEGNSQYNGYTFSVNLNDKTQVMYYNLLKDETSVFIAGSEGYANTVANYGTYFYYMTSDKIMRKTFDTQEVTTIVSDMTIKNDGFGYDFFYIDGKISNLKNIYFYAQIPEDPNEESDSETDKESTKDENYYLYKIDSNGAKKPALVGKN